MATARSKPDRSALGLGTLVLAAGAGLMCAELVGGMTIAPYFGSNVFVWGSVISVFMGALSLGYVLGGVVADRKPGARPLSLLAALAGLLIMAVPLICPPVCRGLLRVDLGRSLNLLRPLAAVVLIYFLPTMFFGMLLPIAVRVASTTLSAVGRVVGRLYALNALGSVAGALATMFLLVPFFGNRAILFGCGAAMILAAGACALLLPKTAPGAAGAASRPAGKPSEAKPVAGLRPLLFTCGLVFMGLQVVGGAEIAPYFGSNIFVWGSVITLFLGALSIGYRLGGRLADRRPTMMTLATVVVAAGVATLLIPLLAPAVCSALAGVSFAGRYNVAVQSLLASVALYLVPTILFAMVAPFAVRLSTQDVNQIGGVAGKLYALSTFGNVAGVLLTTFVLISAVGKTGLLAGAGVLAVAVAVLAVFLHNRAAGERRQPVLVSAVLIVVVVLFACIPKPPLVPLATGTEKVLGVVAAESGGTWYLIEHEYEDPEDGKVAAYHFLRRVRAEDESPYHHIAVIERGKITAGVLGAKIFKDNVVTTRSGRKILVSPLRAYFDGREWVTPVNDRALRFDQYVESSLLLDAAARKIARPHKAGTTYSDLLHLPFLFSREIKSVLIIGGGGGVVPTIFKNAYPGITMDVVEIDPAVVDVAKEWFDFTPDERLRVHVQDGRMFIHNSKDKYDVIILDAYTAGGRIPFHLTTKEFLSDVRDHVNPRGIVLMNTISAVSGHASKLFRAQYKTFKEVFGTEHAYAFPKWRAARMPDVSTNIILIATGRGHSRRLGRPELEQMARNLTASGAVKMPSLAGGDGYVSNMLTVSELKQVRQDDVPVLTDDYAPVDMMVVE